MAATINTIFRQVISALYIYVNITPLVVVIYIRVIQIIGANKYPIVIRIIISAAYPIAGTHRRPSIKPIA
jgi:hypothetical protein